MLRVTCAAAAGECGRALCGVQGGGRSLRHRDVDLRRIARHLYGLLLHRRPIPGVSTRLDLAWRLARLASAQACACGQVVLRGGGGQAVEERPDSAVAQGAQVVRRLGGSACAVNASFVLCTRLVPSSLWSESFTLAVPVWFDDSIDTSRKNRRRRAMRTRCDKQARLRNGAPLQGTI